MVIFFGEVDPGAIEDSKHFKLSMKSLPTEMMESKIMFLLLSWYAEDARTNEPMLRV
jgi:hypothetical protein